MAENPKTSDIPKNVEDLVPPEEFYKIINDFITDILTTFPEYSGIVSRWWNRPSDTIEETKQKETLFVFRHCIKVFPERFFDILYKNVSLFSPDSEVSTEFLPGIVFSQLWSCDISDSTRETIWKYLQLILFSVIGTVHNSNELGDTAKLFEAINEEELKHKLEETLEGMQGMFDASGSPLEGFDASFNGMPMPNAEEIHEHIQSMMGGKLGKLAMELAEETANDLNLDMDNTGTAKDVFQQLFKNPMKLMNMVKNIGSKIDEKIKSGEIKESELMEEGVELLQKMKNMPGMGDMQKMFSQMGVPGLGRGAKMNMGAMEAHLNRNMKQAKTKERMRAKSEAKKTAFCNMSDTNILNQQGAVNEVASNEAVLSEEEIVKIFSTGEKVERTPRGAKPPSNNQASNNQASNNQASNNQASNNQASNNQASNNQASNNQASNNQANKKKKSKK
jgi:hypothetical protein